MLFYRYLANALLAIAGRPDFSSGKRNIEKDMTVYVIFGDAGPPLA